MAIFNVDPDIRRAQTLPSDFYTDERVFELSKEKIFARVWHFAGERRDDRTMRPFDLLPGFLDEPLIIVNDGGDPRCLSNVCTHRGMRLIDGPCDGRLIRCGYHGRRFDLKGNFLSMPEFQGVANFPSERDDLRSVPTASIGDLIFCSVEPAASASDFAGEKGVELLEGLPLATEKLVETQSYSVEAHWALYCENYLEGFHIPFVHDALNEIVDYGTYRTETFRYSSLQTAFADAGRLAAQYLFIFPNLMFNFYPWGLSVNVVRPISHCETIVEYSTYVTDPGQRAEGAGADLHTVELEDEKIVESVQRGIRSRYYSGGRFSPSREQGTHHFHRLIAEFMT